VVTFGNVAGLDVDGSVEPEMQLPAASRWGYGRFEPTTTSPTWACQNR